jgi:uncharacterized protein YbaR (Trm112 family)
MALDPALLELLVCPESREKLTLAEADLVARVNEAIKTGRARNRAGRPVEEAIEAGLVRTDRQYLYGVRADIPNLLIDDAIALEGL